MKTEYRVALALVVVLLTAACDSAPVSPTIIPPRSVAAVPAAVPGVWDSAAELGAWVNNGVSTGPALVVGNGADAVIRVDVASVVNLHGPDLDPPMTGVTSARVRYRWIASGPSDVLLVDMYLRPPTLDRNLSIPHLFYIGSDLSSPPQNSSGEWVEELFTAHGISRPPYSVRFATLTVGGSGTYAPAAIHGTVEIDWVALVRQP
jgi:hypothetical protein